MTRQITPQEKLGLCNFKRPKRKISYPWKQWLNGSIWKITHGTDFTCSPSSMIATIHKTAKAHNLLVTAEIKDKSIIFHTTQNKHDK